MVKDSQTFDNSTIGTRRQPKIYSSASGVDVKRLQLLVKIV